MVGLGLVAGSSNIGSSFDSAWDGPVLSSLSCWAPVDVYERPMCIGVCRV